MRNWRARRAAVCVLALVTLVANIAFAQIEPSDTPTETKTDLPVPLSDDNAADLPVEKPWFGRYGEWIRFQEQLLLGMDLWGASGTIPEGYGILFFGWQHRRAWKRFDEHRKIVDVVPVISADDPFEHKGKFFEFDFGIKGRLQGYGAGFQYGVTDRFMVGISTFWAIIHIDIEPIFTPGSSDQVGLVTLDDFYDLMVELGRPVPKTTYDSDPVDFGDTTVDAKWNYYREEFFSTSIQGGVFLPTSHRAHPQQNLIFGLGPDIDTGAGAWGAKFGTTFDTRPPDPVKSVSFSLTLEGAYFLETRRESPEFPPLNQDVKDYLSSQGVDVDIFPDLTDVPSHYYYTPGPWFAAQFGIGAGPFSIAYRHGFAGAPGFRSSSEGFKQLVDEIGLVGYGDDGKLLMSLNVPLTPLYIPGLLNLSMEYQTDGRNALIFRDVYTIGLGIGLPLAVPDRYKMGSTP
ncbi:hypothetical protein K8I61_15065 [bacterium]|nr:hypothetical protein [bacterium]